MNSGVANMYLPPENVGIEDLRNNALSCITSYIERMAGRNKPPYSNVITSGGPPTQCYNAIKADPRFQNLSPFLKSFIDKSLEI
jgi:hypothetical protein